MRSNKKRGDAPLNLLFPASVSVAPAALLSFTFCLLLTVPLILATDLFCVAPTVSFILVLFRPAAILTLFTASFLMGLLFFMWAYAARLFLFYPFRAFMPGVLAVMPFFHRGTAPVFWGIASRIIPALVCSMASFIVSWSAMFLVTTMVVITLGMLVGMSLIPGTVVLKCQRTTIAVVQVNMGG